MAYCTTLIKLRARECQLCVPSAKRNVVMQMVHDSVFSGHLAERKIRECI